MANISKQIKKSSEEIKDIMQLNLAAIAESMIDQVIKNAKRLPKSQILNSTKDIQPKGVNAYKSDLKATLAVVSSMALDQARSEVPKAKNVKLMESEERLLFGEFEQLPTDIRKRINNANQLLIGTQIADLEKAIFFQFGSSVASDKGLREIEADMTEKAEGYIAGNAIQAGASVSSANTVNEARNAFFFDEKTLDEIEAFQFMNGDPVSLICQDLNGIIFSPKDENAFRFTPPLHFNALCQGSLVSTNRGDIPIEDIKIGDLVLTHKNKYQEVYETMNKFEDKEYFILELENGYKLELTGEHPVLTKNRGWLRTDELTLVDDIVCLEDVQNSFSI